MKRLYKAFTLSELLIALGVIAILCGVLIPMITNLMPNQNTIMAKRAYYALRSAVSEMINDEKCYPDKSIGENPKYGFDDGAGYDNCELWTYSDHHDGDKDKTNYEAARNKFWTILQDKLDGTSVKEREFKTPDGMYWILGSFSNKTASDINGRKRTVNGTEVYIPFLRVIVDVNGSADPNCVTNGSISTGSGELSAQDNTACAGVKENFDRIYFIVYDDGIVNIYDKCASNSDTCKSWAAEAVGINKDVTESN